MNSNVCPESACFLPSVSLLIPVSPGPSSPFCPHRIFSSTALSPRCFIRASKCTHQHRPLLLPIQTAGASITTSEPREAPSAKDNVCVRVSVLAVLSLVLPVSVLPVLSLAHSIPSARNGIHIFTPSHCLF